MTYHRTWTRLGADEEPGFLDRMLSWGKGLVGAGGQSPTPAPPPSAQDDADLQKMLAESAARKAALKAKAVAARAKSSSIALPVALTAGGLAAVWLLFGKKKGGRR